MSAAPDSPRLTLARFLEGRPPLEHRPTQRSRSGDPNPVALRAVVLGTELGPGGYVHVPDGVEHDIDATGSDGCTVYYLYLRPGG